MKKQNQWMWIIGIVALLFLFNNAKKESIAFAPDDFLKSSYVGKIGSPPVPAFEEATPAINWAIDNAYGYVIMESPIILQTYVKDELVDGMHDFNMEVMGMGYSKVFSQDFIDLVNENEYGLFNLIKLKNHLEESKENFCSICVQEPDCDEVIGKICDSGMFDIERVGTKYVVNFDDLYIPSISEFSGNIRLSDLKIELWDEKGSIFIAVHEKGIQEAKDIDGKYEFAQYGHEVIHEGFTGSVDFGEGGYYVASNDNNVIEASNGKIEKSNFFEDLWYGVKGGKAYSDKTFWFIVGGLFIFILLMRR